MTLWHEFRKNIIERDGAYLLVKSVHGHKIEPGANLKGCWLGWANLKNVNLEGANLEDADLEGANLEGANLARANMRGSNLRGTNMAKSDISYADLEGARYDNETNWHCGSFDPDTRGAIWVDLDEERDDES